MAPSAGPGDTRPPQGRNNGGGGATQPRQSWPKEKNIKRRRKMTMGILE